MTILHITSDYPPKPLWGMGQSVYDIYSAFQKYFKQDTVYIATANKSRAWHNNILSTPKNIDIKLLSKKQHEIIDGYDNFIKWNRKLFNIIDAFIDEKMIRFDIIHCHNWMSWVAAFELKKKYNIKIVSTLHFLQKQYEYMEVNPVKTYDQKIIKIEAEMLNHSDAIICLNESQIDFLRDKYNYTSKKITVIPHFINKTIGHKIHRNKKNILFIGRLEKDKGILMLIKVFNKIHPLNQNSRLYIIGDGPLLEKIINKKNPGIICAGYLNKPEMIPYFKKCSIYCLPSKSESFGISVIEAMSQGLCPIFSRGRYLPILFDENKSGLYLDINKSLVEKKLFNLITNLLDDDNKLSKLRLGALKYVNKNYSVKNIKKVKQIYQKTYNN